MFVFKTSCHFHSRAGTFFSLISFCNLLVTVFFFFSFAVSRSQWKSTSSFFLFFWALSFVPTIGSPCSLLREPSFTEQSQGERREQRKRKKERLDKERHFFLPPTIFSLFPFLLFVLLASYSCSDEEFLSGFSLLHHHHHLYSSPQIQFPFFFHLVYVDSVVLRYITCSITLFFFAQCTWFAKLPSLFSISVGAPRFLFTFFFSSPCLFFPRFVLVLVERGLVLPLNQEKKKHFVLVGVSSSGSFFFTVLQNNQFSPSVHFSFFLSFTLTNFAFLYNLTLFLLVVNSRNKFSYHCARVCVWCLDE